jgi:uncharacterized radical SAM superfamily protein
MKKIYVITPNPDENYFGNKYNLPESSNLITNVSALLYASQFEEKGKEVIFFDYYNDYSQTLKLINKTNTEAVHLFLGFANYKNGIKLYQDLKDKKISVTLNGVYNFIDGQNFSDCTLLTERGIKCEKPIVDMDVKINYDLINPLDDLFKFQEKMNQEKSLIIVSQYFGCPKRANCFHCSSDKLKTNLKIKLTKNPKETIQEIMNVKIKYNLDTVIIGDLMSTDNRLKQLVEHTKGIELPKLRISTAANYITEKSVKDLLKLNCKEIFLGIESYNENLIRTLDKSFTLEDVDRAMRLLYKNKIYAHISLMIGIPGETEDTLKRTLDFVNYWKKNKQIDGKPFLRLQVSLFTPIPGSQVYEIFKYRNGIEPTKKLIMGDDWISNLQSRYSDLFLDKKILKSVQDCYQKLSKISDTSYV